MANRPKFTEEEWATCERPHAMLAFLQRRVSYRKQYLFAAACCRLVWPLLPPASQSVVETVERYVDARTVEALDELTDARKSALNAYTGAYQEKVAGTASSEVCDAASLAYSACDPDPHRAADAVAGRQPTVEADLIRDLIGNPFRPVSFNQAWPLWNGGTVSKLAQAIYEERSFDRLPILADALEDAGCTDPVVLEHCRGPGRHARGCWLVDLCGGPGSQDLVL